MLFNFDKALKNGYIDNGQIGKRCEDCKHYSCPMGAEICLVNCLNGKIVNEKVIGLPGFGGWCKKWKKG